RNFTGALLFAASCLVGVAGTVNAAEFGSSPYPRGFRDIYAASFPRSLGWIGRRDLLLRGTAIVAAAALGGTAAAEPESTQEPGLPPRHQRMDRSPIYSSSSATISASPM